MRGSPGPRAPTFRERGAVTVEAAIGLCTLLAVVGIAFAGMAAVAAQLRCTDAAREAARLVARGQPHLAAEAVRAIGPSGARLELRVEDPGVTVSVIGGWASGLLPGLRLRADAYTLLEPGVDVSALATKDVPHATG